MMSVSTVPLRLVEPEGEASPVRDARDENAWLLTGLRERTRAAERLLLVRHTPRVRRILCRILGSTAELDDLTQEVFLRILDRVNRVNDPDALELWIVRFAVNVARETCRSRARRRWLSFFAPEDLYDVEGRSAACDDASDAAAALRATYRTLEGLSADARAAFVLRHVEGMELAEVADACGVSLPTIKRRLHTAEQTFAARARNHPILRTWMEEGGRWR
jgi:RNA polymerase sigma-70 factor (ECF subfamily)